MCPAARATAIPLSRIAAGKAPTTFRQPAGSAQRVVRVLGYEVAMACRGRTLKEQLSLREPHWTHSPMLRALSRTPPTSIGHPGDRACHGPSCMRHRPLGEAALSWWACQRTPRMASGSAFSATPSV
jgi:hypothetical protein